MTIKEARKLREGDKVVWPEGVNGCTQAHGVVTRDNYGGLCISWDDGQITSSLDGPAIKCVEREEVKVG
jgi:hypothetical protein